MSDLRGAIIGYGLAGSVFHAPLIAATEGLAVATVVTADVRRREHVLRDYPGVDVAPTVGELWARSDEHDFVVVATPNAAHASLARSALDAGLPVVVDKPLAPTAAEARGVVKHAESRGALLTVFQNRRWDSDQRTLRGLLSEGRLGDVLRFESRFERWRPQVRADAWREAEGPSEGGGVLIDLGAHLVDQALCLFGPATQVYGEIEHRRRAPGDDDAFVALRHRSGTYSHLWMSALAAAPGPRLRVLGDRAAFVVDEVDGQEDALRAGLRPTGSAPWGVEPESRWGRLVRGEDSEPVRSKPGAWPHFYTALEQALRKGGPPPVDPAEAVATLEVLDAARRSSAERGPVSIPHCDTDPSSKGSPA